MIHPNEIKGEKWKAIENPLLSKRPAVVTVFLTISYLINSGVGFMVDKAIVNLYSY